MSLLATPVEKISEAEIQRLISLGVPESPYLDYKQKTYDDSGDQRSEYLADISSFANTLGGDIVIGVAEENGLPISLTPFMGDCDTEMRRLEEMAIKGIEPRLRNLQFQAVPIAAGGFVLVVRVPRSFMPPHRVIARNSNRFWARAGRMKYEPNVDQLRHLFNDAPQLAERIRSFQTDRIVKITAGDMPFPLRTIGKVALHVMPLPSFADRRMLDIVAALATGSHIPLPLCQFGSFNRGAVNLDGYLNYTVGQPGARSAYAQFFRNGAIEGVGELSSDDGVNSRIVSNDFTNLIVSLLRQYLGVLKSFEMGLPVYAFLSLCNANRIVHRYDVSGLWQDTQPLGREIVVLPEITIDSFDVDVPTAMRPIFNILANAFGFGQCDMYDGQGRWRGL